MGGAKGSVWKRQGCHHSGAVLPPLFLPFPLALASVLRLIAASLSLSLPLTQGMWCTWCPQGGSTTSSASLPMWLSSRPWPRPLAPPLSLCRLLRPPAPPLPPLASAFRLLLTRVRLLAFLLSPCRPRSLQACPGLLSVRPSLASISSICLLPSRAPGLFPSSGSLVSFLPSPQCSFLLQCHQPW